MVNARPLFVAWFARAFVAWFACVPAGCSEQGGETGTEGLPADCAERVHETAVEGDLETPQGTPAAFVERAAGERSIVLQYWIREGNLDPAPVMTEALFELKADVTTARLVDYRQRDAPEIVCMPSLEMDAVVTLDASDGTFREVIPGYVAIMNSSKQFFGSIPLSKKGGSYDVGAVSEPAKLNAKVEFWDDPQLAVPAGQSSAEPYGLSGRIMLSDQTDDGVASRPIAEW